MYILVNILFAPFTCTYIYIFYYCIHICIHLVPFIAMRRTFRRAVRKTMRKYFAQYARGSSPSITIMVAATVTSERPCE